jgi:hypothetical protein
MQRIRGKLTYANVISTLCLFLLLGGGAYAATHLRKNSVGTKQIKKNAVTSSKIKDGAVTEEKISVSAQTALRNIPDGSITAAKLSPDLKASLALAQTALQNIPDGSITAAKLSPDLKASLTLHCPSGLRRVGDICFEDSLRPAATFASALQTCAAAGRWLPSLGELVLAFDHLGAPQDPQWVATQYVDSNGAATSFLGTLLSEDASRAIGFGYDSADPAIPHTRPYRCVTSPTN